MFKNPNSLTIDYKPENRLISDYDLYASLKAAVLENEIKEKEIEKTRQLENLVTRLTVENGILKNEIKRLKEEKECSTVTKN